LRLSLFDPNAVLSPGQEVLTYASVGDQPEVPGVPVGTVISVQGGSGSLTQNALVRPFVNFTALGVVGIVVAVPKHNARVSVLPRPAPTVTITVTPSPTQSATEFPTAPATFTSPGTTGPTTNPSPSPTGSG
jgi:rod shape-determining protein MreC